MGEKRTKQASLTTNCKLPKTDKQQETEKDKPEERTAGVQRYASKGGNTYCVRDIPRSWDREQLQSFLAKHGAACPVIRSLADETDGLSRTATALFQDEPPLQIPLPAASHQSTRQQSLSLDKDFFGITTLYAPRPSDHKVE